MKVTLAVAAYNSVSTIASCVESLLRTEYPDKEIIVVDDGSVDETLSILKKYPVTVLHQDHAGVSAGRDNAFRHATGDIIAYTDSDCEVDKQWITELIKPFSDPQVGATTGRTIFHTDDHCTSWIRSLDIEERYNKRNTYTGLANGTNCAIRKIILEEISGFDPEWFHAEDTEVSYRIVQKGYKIYYQSSAIVRHVPEGDWKSYLRKRYRGTKAHFRIMPKYTKNVLEDDFVSWKMVIQPVIYPIIIPSLVLTIILYMLGLWRYPACILWAKTFFGLSIIMFLIGFVMELPLIVQTVQRSKNFSYLHKSVFLLLGKIMAIGTGVYAGVWGMIEYRLLKKPGEHRNSKSS